MKTKLKVLDCVIDLEIVNPRLINDDFGQNDLVKSKIEISSDLKDCAKSITLIHEILHFIDNMWQLELCEQSIDSISIGIHSFMKNNPGAVKAIQESDFSILGVDDGS